MNHEAHVIMLNEYEKLWVSRAAQALDTRLTNHVVAPSVAKPHFTLEIPCQTECISTEKVWTCLTK